MECQHWKQNLRMTASVCIHCLEALIFSWFHQSKNYTGPHQAMQCGESWCSSLESHHQWIFAWLPDIPRQDKKWNDRKVVPTTSVISADMMSSSQTSRLNTWCYATGSKVTMSITSFLIPGRRSVVHKTMEKTFIRFAKSRCDARVAGLTIILKKYGA